MSIIANKRLCFSFIYLGLLFGIGSVLYTQLFHFEGQLFLVRDVAEHLVVAPHDSNRSIGVSQRKVPADLLLFDNPAVTRLLDRDGVFDAALMPTGLRFERLEVLQEYPDQHTLVTDGPDGVTTERIAPGQSLHFGNRTFVVDEIVSWKGLIRHTRGQAMAAVDFRLAENSPVQRIYLTPDTWNYPDSSTALQFRWYTSEADAQSAVKRSRDTLQSHSRWGVQDGAAIQWFQGLAQGSGLRLRDGRRVSFVEHTPDKRAIHVLVEVNGKKQMVVVPVNGASEKEGIYYQDPSQVAQIIILYAWEEGQALIQYMMDSEGPLELRLLREGEAWLPVDGAAIRLQQVLSHAVPVTPSAGQLFAVQLSCDGRQYTLREGLVKTIGDVRVEYRRTPQPLDALVHLSSVDGRGETRDAFALRQESSHRLGSWVFSLDKSVFPMADRVIVTATRQPGGGAFYLGVILFVMGSFGWAWVRAGAQNR